MNSDMDTSVDSKSSSRCGSPAPPPPRLEDIRKNFLKAHTTEECMQFCVYIDNIIDGIDTYEFHTETSKNQYSFQAYQLQEETRTRYISLKEEERKTDEECHDHLLKQWGRPTEKELAEFVPVPTLTLEEPTTAQNDDEMEEEIIPTQSRTSTPIPKVRPPPPITIDGIAQPAQFLKKDPGPHSPKTNENLQSCDPRPANRHASGGHSRRITKFGESTPRSVKSSSAGKLDFQCLFSVFLENPDNKCIYNLKELCSMKIEVDTMRRKFGPAQCYRCQGILPQFTILHQEPEMREVRETSPHKGLHQDQRRGTNMLPLPGQSPSKLHRLP
ncbi:hypothetical protein TNCV_1859281 [Trichonephila clavipes]|nr:hypothetical protein TNCV_1859281 [Trichonephila clavipes]